MDGNDREFQRRLLQTFIEEAREHVDAIADGLVKLQEARTHPAATIETVFREAHTLKGAARSVGNRGIEQLCQALESVFGAAKQGTIAIADGAHVTVLQTAVDTISDMVQVISTGGPPPTVSRNSELVDILMAVAEGGSPPSPPPGNDATADRETAVQSEPVHLELPATVRQGATETVRVPLPRLDAVWRQSEGLLSVKLAAAQRVREMQQLRAMLADRKRARTKLQPDLRLIQGWLDRSTEQAHGGPPNAAMRRLLEFLEGDREFKHSLTSNVDTLARAAANDEHSLGTMMDSLLDDLEQILMLPCSYAMEGFPRMVRELATARDKEVGIALDGTGLEMDRRILDEIRPALVHLLRNAIDHGIEEPKVRVTKGKPSQGNVRIRVVPLDGRRVEFTVEDDGAGLDSDRLRAAVVSAGIVSKATVESLAEHDLHDLVFHSGVSTSPAVTDISGRGLGMAIVAEKIDRLGGTISLESIPDVGTRFHMVLPMSLAKFNGMLVRVGESQFVIPLTSAERALRIRKTAIRTIENHDTVTVDDQILPLLPLADLLEMPGLDARDADSDYLSLVVIATAGQRLACRVDEVVATQEVLVKSLGPQLERVRNVAGATTLGSGEVVPILNPTDLVKSAAVAVTLLAAPASGTAVGAARPSVLVAEDSVTSRTLLKNILEAAGYKVDTAVDGVDALTKLRGGMFDIVVSDAEMPRMGGFDLTARIRGDEALARLPVVIVTSLDSPADRERGLEAGADAYLVKSDFAQNDLLEIIQRLTGRTG